MTDFSKLSDEELLKIASPDIETVKAFAAQKYGVPIEIGNRLIKTESAGRQDAVSFVINDKAFVGTGYNNGYLKDFYEYNQATDTWRKIADLPDNGRDDAVAFSLTGRGYVGLGWNGTTGVLKDFWQYNPASNAWRINTSLADLGRFGANAWVIDNVPYIGFGSNGISATDEIWKANK
jgi:N-acetylneuraminic acid mutarotase